jgi:hypothetical protein
MSRWSVALTALAAIVLGFGVVLLRELRRVPPPPTTEAGKAETAPLTDVAGPARRPWQPPTAAPVLAVPIEGGAPEVVAVPPSLMPDPSRPPQGTAPLATPGAPVPPDPMQPPPIEQDPERGGRTR